ncbi:MAG: hypothetical protein WD850_00920 [Candidatus Spechtbacterales bacterium]
MNRQQSVHIERYALHHGAMLGIPIDHIFGTEEFVFRLFLAGLHSGSDHRPVVVDISLPAVVR